MLTLALAIVAQGKGVWTDAADATLPPDFKIQGEYAGEGAGAQVIALGKDSFQAVVYPGGLPGAGWDGKNKILMDGKLEGGKASFKPAEGKKKYLAQAPEEFSATSKYPPEGQKAYSGEASGDALKIKTDEGKMISLKKTVRKAPTLGAPAPKGALVLFDGTNTDEWQGGRLDAATKFLNTDGKDIVTSASSPII